MRILGTILALLLVVGGLVAVKFQQISSLIHMGKEMEKAGPPKEQVGTAIATEEAWEGTLTAVGTIAPVRGVAVSNEAPGVVSRILFESGAVVRAGQVLVELDSSVERAQLASADARRGLADLNARRSKALVTSGALAPAQLDNDDAQLKAATTDSSAIQAQIDRKTVRAPFAGRLGIRAVNLGQYLNPGTAITVLEAIDSVYVDFTLPQQRLPQLRVGMPVRVELDAPDAGIRMGAIAAIDPEVDLGTRSIKIRASVPNKEEKLRPGMFATVYVVLPDSAKNVVVPATAVVHAAYGDSVFVAEQKRDDAGVLSKGTDGNPVLVAKQHFVKMGEARGDFVALKDGIKPGDEVVVAGAFKLRNGAGIVVNNDVKPTPQASPHPENR